LSVEDGKRETSFRGLEFELVMTHKRTSPACKKARLVQKRVTLFKTDRTNGALLNSARRCARTSQMPVNFAKPGTHRVAGALFSVLNDQLLIYRSIRLPMFMSVPSSPPRVQPSSSLVVLTFIVTALVGGLTS
jgi:hypothetical protein